RILGFVSHAGLEDFPQRAPLLYSVWIRLRTVVHTDEAGHVLNIRHKTGADDIVLVLEEERRVPIVRPQLVSRDGSVDNYIRYPAILVGEIRSGFGVAVLRTFRSNDHGSEQAVTRIDHHITPIPYQRSDFSKEWIRIEGVRAALTWRDRLVAGIV